MRIDVRIERLVLDEALLGGERPAGVRAGLERELARRLATPGALDALRRIGAVEALPPLALPAARGPQEPLGARIAAALGRGLGIDRVERRNR